MAEIENYYLINQKRMELIENETYFLEDITCLFLDMFGKDKMVFTLDDFMEKPKCAVNLINVLTKFSKFREFINRETYMTPKVRIFIPLILMVLA